MSSAQAVTQQAQVVTDTLKETAVNKTDGKIVAFVRKHFESATLFTGSKFGACVLLGAGLLLAAALTLNPISAIAGLMGAIVIGLYVLLGVSGAATIASTAFAYRLEEGTDSWTRAAEMAKFDFISTPVRALKLWSNGRIPGLENSYDIIPIPNNYPKEADLFLGAQLNGNVPISRQLGVTNTEKFSMLSMIETKALSSRGVLVPFVHPKDKNRTGAYHKHINVPDHTALNKSELHDAADFIENALKKGHKVYVHCAAGHGRSGMAIAAYLIKYCGMTPGEAANLIMSQREDATVWKDEKRLALEVFYADVIREKIEKGEIDLNKRPEASSCFSNLTTVSPEVVSATKLIIYENATVEKAISAIQKKHKDYTFTQEEINSLKAFRRAIAEEMGIAIYKIKYQGATPEKAIEGLDIGRMPDKMNTLRMIYQDHVQVEKLRSGTDIFGHFKNDEIAIAVYLIKHEGMKPDKAIKKIQHKIPHAAIGDKKTEKALKSYYKCHKNRVFENPIEE